MSESPVKTEPQLITVSRLKMLAMCPRAHQMRYELGWMPTEERKALRIGSMFHLGLDLLAQGADTARACDVIRERYGKAPDYIEPFDWAVERETVLALLCGYDWRWKDERYEFISTESTFSLPILNPETNATTPLFRRAGKIDKKVKLPDGRIAMVEHKTCSESIEPGAIYWDILRLDPQVSMYFDSDPEIETIIYDVIRKPGIAPKQVPLVDELGFKIVMNADRERIFLDNGKPRQSADKDKGWELMTRVETPDEFRERLLADIAERPDFYYARREVPRLLSDIETFREDLWQAQKMLRYRQIRSFWPRTPSRQACGMCSFTGPCFSGIDVTKSGPPTGFIVGPIHPELQLEPRLVIAEAEKKETTPDGSTNTN